MTEESYGSHAGRPGSWLAVLIIFIGFLLGGIALCIGPLWIAFWVGIAVVAVGVLVSGLVHLFSDIVLDAPRVIPEIVDYSLFGSHTTKRRGGLTGETAHKPIATDTQEAPHG
ncbi:MULTISPECIES: HGxxPAAW family protein [Thermomonosporaceae]|uniref:HGxxPAAW family protein n=1 Tax=Thermomonosporaceae TaxID=2012 RepID=UPI00255B0080|nr:MULTISPECIES: HGxxPAAW family protein [Thermomonosporaceae]MDL4776007.1 HGxxPAAW family protein [Actinomadura xylanilytica]